MSWQSNNISAHLYRAIFDSGFSSIKHASLLQCEDTQCVQGMGLGLPIAQGFLVDAPHQHRCVCSVVTPLEHFGWKAEEHKQHSSCKYSICNAGVLDLLTEFFAYFFFLIHFYRFYYYFIFAIFYGYLKENTRFSPLEANWLTTSYLRDSNLKAFLRLTSLFLQLRGEP